MKNSFNEAIEETIARLQFYVDCATCEQDREIRQISLDKFINDNK